MGSIPSSAVSILLLLSSVLSAAWITSSEDLFFTSASDPRLDNGLAGGPVYQKASFRPLDQQPIGQLDQCGRGGYTQESKRPDRENGQLKTQIIVKAGIRCGYTVLNWHIFFLKLSYNFNYYRRWFIFLVLITE